MDWHQRVWKKNFVVSAEPPAPEPIGFHLDNKGISIFYPGLLLSVSANSGQVAVVIFGVSRCFGGSRSEPSSRKNSYRVSALSVQNFWRIDMAEQTFAAGAVC
jgi:hypothetical protein